MFLRTSFPAVPAPWAPRNAVAAVCAVVVLTLAGCAADSSGSAPTTSETDLQIVATTTQVADFSRNVVGDTEGITLTQLIHPNQSVHSYDPSAADLLALARADVLVVNGVDLEEWLDAAVDASGFDGLTIDAAEGIEIQQEASENQQKDAHAPHAGHLDEHAPGAGNPHIWTSVPNAAAMSRTIAGGFALADPVKAAAFEANLDAYAGQLAALDAWIRTNVEAVPAEQRLLVSNHDALGYFTSTYGITYVGSVIPSFDDNAEPSAAQIDELVAAIKRTGVKAVFSEASVNPKTAKTIASEANVTVYSGADALYVDSLGPAGSAGDTYIGAQLHDVELILASWGVTPSAVPAELR